VVLGTKAAAGLVVVACAPEPAATTASTTTAPSTIAPDVAEATPIVEDVVDFALSSDDWEGPFGSVTLRLYRAMVEGNDVYFVRTDASDADYAVSEGLVAAPRLSGLLSADLTGRAYYFDDGTDQQAVVLSSEPGRPDYSPAFRVHRVRWEDTPKTLTTVTEVEEAEERGQVAVEAEDIVINASIVKWSSGELPVDDELSAYLGPGQLLEPPDTNSMTVTFKLHECFPNSRYIVVDTDLEPMAEGMQVAHSPQLGGATDADGTGRTNVFMNGIEGSGPMGFQPSVFDSQAGAPEWSPYWDHMTYAWKDGIDPRVLRTEEEIHDARDRGDLDEFPGTPDTDGATFVVNCPVPVIAPNEVEA
jgi:hypothetical protein